jgi:hypothetical protein
LAGPRRLFYPDSGQRIRKSALADLRAFWGVSISDFFRDAMSAGADLRVNHLTNEPRWRQRAAHAVDAGRWRDARRPSRKFPIWQIGSIRVALMPMCMPHGASRNSSAGTLLSVLEQRRFHHRHAFA